MQVELQQYHFLVMIDCFLVMIDGVDFMNANTSLYLHSCFFSGLLARSLMLPALIAALPLLSVMP